jgi:hypothetical protein
MNGTERRKIDFLCLALRGSKGKVNGEEFERENSA